MPGRGWELITRVTDTRLRNNVVIRIAQVLQSIHRRSWLQCCREPLAVLSHGLALVDFRARVGGLPVSWTRG